MVHDKGKEFTLPSRRQLACENSRFEVFLDDVEDANGATIRDYLVVAPRIKTGDLITGVAVMPVVEGKLGLLHIYRHAIQRHLWEIPRGFVDPGESERGSALRELEEETGLSCMDADLESLGIIAPEPGILAARVHLFAALRCRAVRPFSGGEFGHKEFRWFVPEQVSALREAGEIQDPCTLIAYFQYQNMLK